MPLPVLPSPRHTKAGEGSGEAVQAAKKPEHKENRNL